MRRVFESGFRTALWMDAAFQPIASISPLWAEIKGQGWYIQMQGDAVLGNWCSDRALEIFGIDRDEAMQIPLCFSGIVGIDKQTWVGSQIWSQWESLYERGAFDGPHLNAPHWPQPGPWGYKIAGDCSHDPRCCGHRHDEAALSFILYSMGLKPRDEPFLTLGSPEGFIGHKVELQCQ